MANYLGRYKQAATEETRTSIEPVVGGLAGMYGSMNIARRAATYFGNIDARSERKWGTVNLKDFQNMLKRKHGLDVGVGWSPGFAGDALSYASRDYDPTHSGMRRHGFINVPPGSATVGNLSHEAGHARARAYGTRTERAATKIYGNYGGHLGRLGPLAAAGVGLGVLSSKYGEGATGTLTAMGAGAATGLAFNAPVLISEHAANRHAKLIAPKASAKFIKRWPALATYYAMAALPGLLTPLLSRGVESGIKAIRQKPQSKGTQ